MSVGSVDQVLAVVVAEIQVELARHEVAKHISVLLRPLSCVCRAQVAAVRSCQQPPSGLLQELPHTWEVWKVVRDRILDRTLAVVSYAA